MNVLRNMEAIFLVAAVLAGITTYASAAAGDTPAVPARQHGQAAAAVQQPAPMAVVHVSAKRLSAAEKAAL